MDNLPLYAHNRTVTLVDINSPYRKRIRHIHEPGHYHELTFSCYQRRPLLMNEEWKRLFTQALNRAIPSQGFQLIAFVYMPEHLHLLVFPVQRTAQIDRLLFALKRPFSYQVKQQLERTNDPLRQQLTIQERPGKQVFRFWQEGPGYDRNIVSQKALITAIEYMHNNPVRRKLSPSPDLWKWSSWKYYHLADGFQDPDLPTVHKRFDMMD
ncbi:MAG: transposase [Candidatus Binatia bacterium]